MLSRKIRQKARARSHSYSIWASVHLGESRTDFDAITLFRYLFAQRIGVFNVAAFSFGTFTRSGVIAENTHVILIVRMTPFRQIFSLLLDFSIVASDILKGKRPCHLNVRLLDGSSALLTA